MSNKSRAKELLVKSRKRSLSSSEIEECFELIQDPQIFGSNDTHRFACGAIRNSVKKNPRLGARYVGQIAEHCGNRNLDAVVSTLVDQYPEEVYDHLKQSSDLPFKYEKLLPQLQAIAEANEKIQDREPELPHGAAASKLEEAKQSLKTRGWLTHILYDILGWELEYIDETIDKAETAAQLADRENEILSTIETIRAHKPRFSEETATESEQTLEEVHNELKSGQVEAAEQKITQAKEEVSEYLTENSGDAVSKIYDLIEKPEGRLEEAERFLQKNEYERAIEICKDAYDKYAKAHDIAKQRDLQEESRLNGAVSSVEQRLRDSYFEKFDHELERADAQLDENPVAAEEEFKKIIETIDSTKLNTEQIDTLRRRAQRGHLEAQIRQARQKRDRAVRQFEQREYYEAREAFEDVREFLKPVLSLASKYGFTDEKEELLCLDRLCEVNADEARQALHETGTASSDVSSIDDIDIEEGPPPQAGSRPAAQDGRPTRKPADKLASQSGNGLPDSHGELRTFTDDKPAHEKLERLGSGSDSVVWKVELSDSGEIAALKEAFLGPETIPIEDVKRFLTTSKTWSDRDDHPHIVSVYGFGYDARPWLLIEYMVEGSLKQYIGDIPVADGIEHIANIADALAYTRDADHHDIKPDNILLSAEKQAKLADWELAKIAFRHKDRQTGISPPYAAPEQFDRSRGPLDDRTDIYQLGVTAYELLTGELPYDPSTPDFEQRVLEGQPQLPSEISPQFSAKIDRIILRAMAADRDKRYEKANEFRNDLREVQNAITSSE